jgi:predicted permease
LKESGGRGSAGLRGRHSRNALVVSQLALACALLICAGLILRTIQQVVEIDWGFEHRNLLTFQLELPETRYEGDDQVRGFFDQVLPRLRALPGVQSAAAVDPLPIFGGERTVQLELEGWTAPRKDDRPWAVAVSASDDYLGTIDLPLLRGRSLSAQDAPEGTRVAMVTRELVRRYWPDADPIGRRLAIQDDTPGVEAEWLEVVGVTGDFRSPDITDAPKPTVFLPMSQSPRRVAAILVRGGTDPGSLAPAIRQEIRLADAELAIYQLQTMEQTNREQSSSDQILLGMFTSFALVALLMAAAGLYASMSYSVSQRKQEIGIRMALGARGSDVRGMILGQGARLVALSLAFGLLGGFSLGRAMASLLYGVTATDPLTYGGVALVLLGVALIASYVPALRATRIDPIETLRVQ